MAKKVVVSAPSTNTTGVADANDVAKETFGKDVFPCVKTVKNNSPMTFFFTGLNDTNGNKLILRGNIQSASYPNETTVEFKDFDELNSFISDCEAYADAHGFKDAIVISDVEVEVKLEPKAEQKQDKKG